MTNEYCDYEYCDSEDETSDIYISKVIRYENVVFEYFKNVADDVAHVVPGKGKFTCAYHY